MRPSDASSLTPRLGGNVVDRRYHNARADDCSIPCTGPAPMTVHYQGADYSVIGVYFTVRSGRHEICYVLRPAPPSGEEIVPAETDGTSPTMSMEGP